MPPRLFCDMRSQLTSAAISAINDANWLADYSYYDNGDMAYRTIQSDNQLFDYNGHIMTAADGNPLTYDENGQLLSSSRDSQTTNYEYNWDGKLRSAAKSNTTINLKYDPAGNRISKDVNDGQTVTARKYIVDIVGDLPTVLLEIDDSNDDIKKTYIYANSQILAEHNGSYAAPRYFHLHDRLGSVRLIIDTSADVKNFYTYNPFGELFPTETVESVLNPFKFSGQWFDEETGEYYLRARMYDPYIGRFTSRDPVFGKFENPLMLHRYLYCGNNPINYIDLDGNFAVIIGGSGSGNLTIGGGSSLTKGFGLMGYYIGVLSHFSHLVDNVGPGGTVGAGVFFGKNTEKTGWLNTSGWFWGDIRWAAAGGSVASGSGASFTADFGYSPNAMKGSDLGGWFTEYGGSVTFPAPVGSPFCFATGSFTYSVGDTGIKLYTVSGGAGTSVGGEGHIYRGYAWVNEW